MKLVILAVFCVIAQVQSDNGYNRRYGPYMQGYTTIKRVKYSNPPQRFYSRPPPSFLSTGAFSYTPPPRYMMDNDPPPYPGNSNPGNYHPGSSRIKVSKIPINNGLEDDPPSYPGNSYPGDSFPGNSRLKVSKRPTNEGLGEEDLQNFVKYLTKQDLDKIFEYAGHNRQADHEKYVDRPMTDEYRQIYNSIQDSESSPKQKENDAQIFNAIVKEIDVDPKFSPYKETRLNNENKNIPINFETDSLPSKYNDFQRIKSNKYSNQLLSYGTEPKAVDPNIQEKRPSEYKTFANFVANPTSQSFYTENQIYNAALENQDSFQRQTDLTDKDLPEEILPRPINHRDDDFELSYTHNIPTVVKANNYKLENFGELPLMNYNSKLDTQSSYHVPHYTVTSSNSQSSNTKPSYSYSAPPSFSSSSDVPIEPAPPLSAAKEQSDAHLKATKIWSHRSKGTAYTLHDDGTLSLEKPGRAPYGYS